MLPANKLGCITKLEKRAKTSQFERTMDLDGLAFSTKHDGMKKNTSDLTESITRESTA